MNRTTEHSAVQRREMILNRIRKNESVSVHELSELFCVSDMTIRRDLHILEEQRLVDVHYGGATLRNIHPGIQNFSARQNKLDQYKLAIARTAAGYIQNGDILFLDTSTTILWMLRFLPDVDVTIVTNSLPVMVETYANPHIHLIIAPGTYQEQYGGPLDYSTAEYVSQFHYTKAFFGASAVDAAFGASATRESESSVKRCVYANADHTYLLADHTKFGRKNLMKYNDVRDYEQIFTDPELDDIQKSVTLQAGGHIVLCT